MVSVCTEELALGMENQDLDYFRPLDGLEFDQDYLSRFVDGIPEMSWYIFDCGRLRWTVQEDYGTVRTECTAFTRTDWFQELYRLFKLPIQYGDVFFTRTPPPGIPPHIDRNRPVAINLPVKGDFVDSPMIWYSSFGKGSEVTRFYHSQKSSITAKPTALLFNPQKIHGVINTSDVDRCLLSFWWRNINYDQFLNAWEDGSLIDWQVNKTNKYIKVLRK